MKNDLQDSAVVAYCHSWLMGIRTGGFCGVHPGNGPRNENKGMSYNIAQLALGFQDHMSSTSISKTTAEYCSKMVQILTGGPTNSKQRYPFHDPLWQGSLSLGEWWGRQRPLGAVWQWGIRHLFGYAPYPSCVSEQCHRKHSHLLGLVGGEKNYLQISVKSQENAKNNVVAIQSSPKTRIYIYI